MTDWLQPTCSPARDFGRQLPHEIQRRLSNRNRSIPPLQVVVGDDEESDDEEEDEQAAAAANKAANSGAAAMQGACACMHASCVVGALEPGAMIYLTPMSHKYRRNVQAHVHCVNVLAHLCGFFYGSHPVTPMSLNPFKRHIRSLR